MSVPVDVCLVAEGSYPYITGGVSSWTHQLVCGLPEVRFALVSLVPDVDFVREPRYPVPENVVVRQNVVMFPEVVEQARGDRLGRELKAAIEAMHAATLAKRCPYFATVEQLLRSGGHTAAGLLAARATWDLIQNIYRHHGRNVSFLDYYWTWRAIHAPMFRLLDAKLPLAAVYHPISTGYAGFAASVAALRTGAPLALTEHGLYTREREIEISQAPWIYEPPARGSAFAPTDGFFHDWWRAKYQFLEKLTYERASRVVHLHGVNAQAQIDAGADARKIVVVPNGIRIERFAAARVKRAAVDRPFEVALVGRVVPIKDVLSFLRAVQLAAHEVPLVAHVLGPTDEDPPYFQECLSLVKLLGLEGVVTFRGKIDVATWMARLDLVVSTSISESQPLALLEAMAAGVPVVATDVGACREMLEGRTGDDAMLGASGVIVPVVSPALVARTMVDLARDPARCQVMGESGIKRVERFYTEERFLDAYRTLYRTLASGAKLPAAPARGR